MELSRRDALRLGGGLLATAGAAGAGCIEERVTRRQTRVRDSTTWALNPAVGMALDGAAFEEYVSRSVDRFGDSGVWGLDGQPGETLETAYVQRLALSGPTSDDPVGSHSSLDPDEVDPDDPVLIADGCVAVYDVGDGRYRYWLWIAADGDVGRLTRDVDLAVLGVRVAPRSGVLADTAQLTGTDEEAQASLGSPPSGSFPLGNGTRTVDTTSELGEAGFYTADWNGAVDGVQSLNAVCEEERSDGGEHDFRWSIAAGYTREERV